MPDFKVTGPLVETVDRRGDNFNKGLGGEKVSPLANAVDGFFSGYDKASILSARVQQTRRDNDPKKLAEEQTTRELNNQIRKQELQRLETLSKYTGPQAQANLDATRASTAASRASTLSSIEGTRGKKIENDLNQRFGAAKILDSFRNSPKSGRSSSTPTLGDAGMGEGPNVSSSGGYVQSETDILVDRLFENELLTKAASDKNILSNKIDLSEINRRTIDQHEARRTVAKTNFDNSMLPSQRPNFDGTPAVTPALPHLAGNNSLYRSAKTPEEQQKIQAMNLEWLSANKAHIDSYLDSLEDPKERQVAEDIINETAAIAGDKNFYSPEQKVLSEAGFSQESIAKPKETFAQIDQYISKGGVGIKNKEVLRALEASHYVYAAREASRGTGANVQRKEMPIPTNNDTFLDAEPKQGPTMMYVFSGEGGSFNAPEPRNDKERNALDLVTDSIDRKNKEFGEAQKQSAAIDNLIPKQPAPQQQTQPSSVGANPNVTQESKPVLTQEQIERNTYPIDQSDGVKRKKLKASTPITAAKPFLDDIERDLKAKDKDVFETQKALRESKKDTSNREQGLKELNRLIQFLKDKKLTNYTGETGRLSRALSSLGNNLGVLNNTDKDTANSLIERVGAFGIFEALARGVGARGVDVKAEQDRATSLLANANTPFQTMVINAALLEEAVQREKDYDTLEAELLKGGVRPEARESILNRYVNEQHPLVEDRNSELGYRRNEKYRSAKDFIKTDPEVRSLLTRQEIGEDISFEGNNPDLINTPSKKNAADLVENKKEDDFFLTNDGNTPNDGSTPPISGNDSSSVDNFDYTIDDSDPFNALPTTGNSDEEDNVLSKAKEFIGNAIVGIEVDRNNKKTKLLKERLNQDKGFRQKVDQFKKDLKNVDMDPGFFDKVTEAMTPDFIEKTIGKAFGNFADTVRGTVSAGVVAPFSDKTFSELRKEYVEDNKAFTQAREELFDDEALDEPGNQLLAEGMAFAIMGGFAKQVTPMALNKLAEVSPVGKGVLKFFATAGQEAPRSASLTQKLITGSKSFVQRAIPEASIDGALLAIQRSDSIEDAVSNFKVGAGFSLGVQFAIGLASGASSGFISTLKNTAGKGDPERILTEAIVTGGGSKETLTKVLQNAKGKSEGEFIANVLGELPPTERSIVETFLRSPEGIDILGQNADDILRYEAEQTFKAETKASMRQSDVRPTKDIISDFDKAVTDISEKQAATTLKTAETSKKFLVNSITKNIRNKSFKEAEKQIDDISSLVGKKPTKLSDLVGGESDATGDFVSMTIDKRVSDLKEIEQALTNEVTGGFKALEKRPPISKELAEDLDNTLRTRFGENGRIAIEQMSRELQGVKSGAFSQPFRTASEEGVTKVSTNPQFLFELRTKLSEGSFKEIGPKQTTQMLEVVDSYINKAFPKEGSGLLNSVTDTLKLRDKVRTRINVNETIRSELSKENPRGIRDKIFTKNNMEALEDSLGKQEVTALDNQLKALDKALNTIKSIKNGKRDVDTAGLSSDVYNALKLVGNNKFFAKEILKIENPSLVVDMAQALNRTNNAELLRDGVLKAIRDNLDDASTIAKNIESGSPLNGLTIAGLSRKEWDNARFILGRDTAEVLEQFFDREINTANVAALYQAPGRTKAQQELATAINIAPRRLIETQGKFGLDIATRLITKTMSSKERQLVVDMFKDPKSANDVFKRVVNLMEKVPTSSGYKTVVIPREGKERLKQVLASFYAGTEAAHVKQNKLRTKQNEERLKLAREIMNLNID